MRNKVLPQVLSAAALLALVSLAQAAGFALTSPEIKSGGTMPKSFEVQRVRLFGRKQVARTEVVRCSRGNQELRRDRL